MKEKVLGSREKAIKFEPFQARMYTTGIYLVIL